jgi:hypothetical protein
MSKVGPVKGIVIHQFYNDEAFWAGRCTEDEEFEVGGERTCDRPFHDAEDVYLVGGYVEAYDGRPVINLTTFFQQWLATQQTTFVVSVPDERRGELTSLLEQHGFAFTLGGKAVLETDGRS